MIFWQNIHLVLRKLNFNHKMDHLHFKENGKEKILIDP